jgi:hypothetical protein
LAAGVTITVLHTPDCPNLRLVDERLLKALAQAGRDDVHVQHRLITTPEQAAAAGFRGSPTVLLDGRDPFGDPAVPASLSCRLYPTEAGLAGAPTVEQLLAVLS